MFEVLAIDFFLVVWLESHRCAPRMKHGGAFEPITTTAAAITQISNDDHSTCRFGMPAMPGSAERPYNIDISGVAPKPLPIAALTGGRRRELSG
jgi:hypothetical protein